MVYLDDQLIARAKALIVSRESSHHIQELIFSYRLAVELHNLQWGSHVVYENRYERALRVLVSRRPQIARMN